MGIDGIDVHGLSQAKSSKACPACSDVSGCRDPNQAGCGQPDPAPCPIELPIDSESIQMPRSPDNEALHNGVPGFY